MVGGLHESVGLLLGFLTVAVALTVNVVAVAVAYGKLKQWTLDHEAASERQRLADQQAATERWLAFTSEASRRWDRIERTVGISNGGAKFMDRDTCAAMHATYEQQVQALERDVAAVNKRVTEGVEYGRQAAEEGRRDRADLRERVAQVDRGLVHVESMMEQGGK